MVNMERRKKMLQYIDKYQAENGVSPTQREIRAAVGVASTNTVHAMLHRMEADGMLRIVKRGKRMTYVIE